MRKPRKKKISPIVKDKIEYIDYKDVNLLRAFISDRAKIRGQRVSGNNRHQQRDVAKAIKVAREMALIPYAQRVVTQRKGDRRRGRSDREPRNDDREPRNDDRKQGNEEFVEQKNADAPTDEFVESAEISEEMPAEVNSE
ncbi:MAG TPA: 30S ribosomal protein S18 [Acidimicrobiia bacterium]|nr:30S ribosomal protein S18 [Acidimicrobiia bacterium]HIL05483.1 30S ribosomal protein S18 [Acidimicrobiia bacterium]